MKKILLGLFIVAAMVAPLLAAHAGVNVAGDGNIPQPIGVRVIEFRGSSDTLYDSLDVAGRNIYGPYSISVDPTGCGPIATGLQANYPALTVASGDSISLSYQIIAKSSTSAISVADTMPGGWTAFDTCTAAAKLGNYASLSNKAGNAIVFRVLNIDGTGVLIAKKIRIAIIGTVSAQTILKK